MEGAAREIAATLASLRRIGRAASTSQNKNNAEQT
jgi:hypothetical protein